MGKQDRYVHIALITFYVSFYNSSHALSLHYRSPCPLALAKASEDWPGEGLEEVVVHYDEVVVASSARPSVTEPSETKVIFILRCSYTDRVMPMESSSVRCWPPLHVLI